MSSNLSSLNIRNALLIDFENNLKLDPSFIFNRPSIASAYGENGILKEYQQNVPRINYGNKKGLLLESAKTNFLLDSGTLNSSYWNPTSFNITANPTSEKAPTGDYAYAISANSDQAIPYHRTTIMSKTITDYTLSVFVKRGSCRYVGIDFSSYVLQAEAGMCFFDFDTETIASTTATEDPQKCGFEKHINGWYRVWCRTEFKTGAPTLINCGFFKKPYGEVQDVYTPDDILGYQASWMCEEGRDMTSYIKTASATVTRSQDSGLILPIKPAKEFTIIATYESSIARSQNTVTFMRDSVEVMSLKGGISTGAHGHYVRDVVVGQDIGSSVRINRGVKTTQAVSVGGNIISAHNNHSKVVWSKDMGDPDSYLINTLKIGLNANSMTYSGVFHKLLVIPNKVNDNQLIYLSKMMQG